jgi:hypothetical protein
MLAIGIDLHQSVIATTPGKKEGCTHGTPDSDVEW